MNSELFAVRSDATVRELAALLAERQITGAPVVDRDGHLVGVVSLTDIVESETDSESLDAEPGDPARDVREWDQPALKELRGLRVTHVDRLVTEIMTPTVYTVGEHTPVAKIARTMIAGRIHRLFVTRGGRVTGIVTSLDLLKLLCEEG